MVHNLRMVSWKHISNPGYGFDFALQMNDTYKNFISSGDFKLLIQFEKLGPESRLVIPTPMHYLPLLYMLGLKSARDKVSFFNDKAITGSLTMTSVKMSSTYN